MKMKRREETEQAERLRQKIVQQQRRKQEEEQRQEKKRMEAEKIRQAAEAEVDQTHRGRGCVVRRGTFQSKGFL